MKAWIALVIPIAIAQSAHAGFIDGNELYRMCEKSNPVACYGYIMGIAEVMEKTTNVMADSGMMICLPTNTQIRQLRDVVLTNLRENPANRSSPAHYIVMKALQRAWPCT